jgi:two-component system, NarL family, response regulator LiaR
MYKTDRAPRAPGVVRNTSQRGLPGAAPAESITALGYLSLRPPGPSDPELRHQQATIQEFCARRGWRLVSVPVEVESPAGRRLGRPSLAHAIGRLWRGDADCLVVAHIERLCPTVAELGGILDAVHEVNARLVSLEPQPDTGTQVGRAAAHQLTRMSPRERRRRAAMTFAARAKLDAPNAIPPDVKRRIVPLRSAGLTLQTIADELNDDGIRAVPGGARWRPSSMPGHPAAREGGREVRVVIADEDRRMRNELRAALRNGGLSVVGQAGDALQAAYLAARCDPDVILVDLTLPPGGGVAAMRELAKAAPGARVVLLAGADDDEAGLAALAEGAAGYLSREIDRGSLARAVGRVVAGEAAISRAMAGRVVERLRELSRGSARMRPVRSPLTPREWEVLDLLAVGASTAEIAGQLVVAPDTVRSHIRQILRKLDVHSRREAIEIAEQLRRQPD